jgi:exodeoxyribonuclease VII small subunit
MKTMVKKFVYIEKKTELEEVLAELQSPSLNLEDAVDIYKKGLSLVEEIEDYLTKTKNTIIELKNNLEI